jgi:uncharacterized membrane protein
MTDLIVIGFDEPGQADLAMAKVQDMAEIGLIDVENVCVVVRDRNGKASYRSTKHLPVSGAGAGAALGSLWGLVLGALLVPFTGGASAVAAETVAGMTWLGAVGGAAAGAMDREDFDDDFTRGIETLLRPGTSALCALVRGYHVTDTDERLRRLQPLHGTVLRTNLSPEAEAKLQRALAASA